MFKMPQLKLVELESPKDRLERYLSVNDKRPNFIKRNLYNALNWNVVAVLDSPKFDEEIVERSWTFTGRDVYTNSNVSFMNKLLQHLLKDEQL